jgi:hypothetical protein
MQKNLSKIRQKLLRKCVLPDIPETQHCFADSTHHTCCMLGAKSREYADSSGNPIGALSVRVQGGKTTKASKTSKTSGKLVPWCTCTGSKVCSYYSNKFGKMDGTRIKFIGTLKPRRTHKKNQMKQEGKQGNSKQGNGKNKTGKNSKKNARNNSRKNTLVEWNEDNAIQQLGLMRHRTSGVI